MSWARLLYSIALHALVLATFVWFFIKDRRNHIPWRRLAERFGLISALDQTRPWIVLHAASVGEVMAAKPLIESLLRQYPEYQVCVSTFTPTGSQIVQKVFANSVTTVFLPFDLNAAVHLFLERLKPQLMIIMETEIWPNLLASCHKKGIPVVMFNARVSEHSSYARFRSLTAEALGCVQFIGARSASDLECLQGLGADPHKSRVLCNIKYSVSVDESCKDQGRVFRGQWGNDRIVWLAASTHSGEDELVLSVYKALKKQWPDLLLILVPRHRERFDAVAQLCQASGHCVQRRSTGQAFTVDVDVVLGDSMGELLSWYASADIALIGGSLLPQGGGHNPLEAAAFSLAIVSGSRVTNFQDLYPSMQEKQAVVLVDDAEALKYALQKWLEDSENRLTYGVNAKHFLRQSPKVLEQYMSVVSQWLPSHE